MEYLCKWNGLTYADCSWEEEGGPVTAEHVSAYKALASLAGIEKAEEERRKKHGWLTISAAVEVMPGEGTYAGAWCPARTISLPNDGMVAVEYVSLHVVISDEKSPKLRQKVKLSRVRPLPPSSSLSPQGPSKVGRKPSTQSESKLVANTWGDRGKPVVGDAVQIFYGQAWWRATVRAVRQVGELLNDLRDERKLAADTKLLLQPVEDPNDQKRKPGERREGRDGRMYELCELRADTSVPSSVTEPEGGGVVLDDSQQQMDDLQLGSIAAVREWRLLPQPSAELAAPAEEPPSMAQDEDDNCGGSNSSPAAAGAIADEDHAEDAEDATAAAAPRGKRRSRSSKDARSAKRLRSAEERKMVRAVTNLTHLRGVPRAELPGKRIVVTYNEDQQLDESKQTAKPVGGKDLVGIWIEVYWEGDKIWYRAQVRAFLPAGISWFVSPLS